MTLQLGRGLLRLGRRNAAQRAFRDVLQCRGDDVRAYLYLGRIALLNGDKSAAMRELDAARHANPREYARLVARLLGERWQRDAGVTVEGATMDPASELALSSRKRQGESPFTPPRPPAAQDWTSIWYLDASGQGGFPLQAASWAGRPDDESSDGDEWPNLDDDFWNELGGESIEDASGAWWRDSNGPRDDLDADLADDELFSSDREEGHEDADETPSWETSPLAAFYDELRNSNSEPSEAAPRGDFLDEDEAQRFQDLPPIAKKDLEDLDWDALHARLADEFEG